MIYTRPVGMQQTMLPCSTGEFILRSAAAVEQMAGGITTRLWDDPFEWTLPEQIPTVEHLLKYLNEVAESRRNALGFIQTAEDLFKRIPAPVEIKALGEIILDTLATAESLYGQAHAIHQIIKEAAEA